MRDSDERERLSWRGLLLWQRDVPRRYLVGQLLWCLLGLGVTFFAIILSPSPVGHGTHQQLGLPPCASVVLFQRPCPGCGLTTSFTATVHGRLAEAFSAHALGPIMYAGLLVSALVSGYGFVRGWRWRIERREVMIALILVLAGLVTYGGVRFANARAYVSLEPQILRGR